MPNPTDEDKRPAFELISEHGGTNNVGRLRTAIAQLRADAYAAGLAAGQNEEVVAMLKLCRSALLSLPKESLGRDPEGGWFYRDELLASIEKLIGPSKEEQP